MCDDYSFHVLKKTWENSFKIRSATHVTARGQGDCDAPAVFWPQWILSVVVRFAALALFQPLTQPLDQRVTLGC